MNVAVIIPAFNEGPRINAVLEAITRVNLFSQIIVVDDGSTDNTAAVARKYWVSLMRHNKNLGKGAALQTGLKKLNKCDAVLFIDADLIGLNESHVNALLSPLINDGIDMSVGVFSGGRPWVDLQQRLFSILNGQRALTYQFAKILPDLSWTRWGVEVLLTRFANRVGVKTAMVNLYGLSHFLKEEKFGLVKGFKLRIQMYKEALVAQLKYRKMVDWPASYSQAARILASKHQGKSL